MSDELGPAPGVPLPDSVAAPVIPVARGRSSAGAPRVPTRAARRTGSAAGVVSGWAGNAVWSVFAGLRAARLPTGRRRTDRRARASGTTTQAASTTKSKMAASLRAPATSGSGASWPIPQATNARTATSRKRPWRPFGG